MRYDIYIYVIRRLKVNYALTVSYLYNINLYVCICIYIGRRRERIISRNISVVVVNVLGPSSLGSLTSVTSNGKVSTHPYRLWAPLVLLSGYISVGLKRQGCEDD